MAKKTRREYEALSRAKASASRGARLREIDRIIAERRMRVEPFGAHGAKRIVGDGIDLLVAPGHWNAVSLADLEPARPRAPQ